jgi:hypothetical protein
MTFSSMLSRNFLPLRFTGEGLRVEGKKDSLSKKVACSTWVYIHRMADLPDTIRELVE